MNTFPNFSRKQNAKVSHASNNKSMSKQRGVTLIESVIALLIFSLGVLGLTAMQLTSLGASGSSQQRSIVIWKAQEFVDRIKSNRAISDRYITSISNQDFASIGVDGNAGLLNCANFAKPATVCADEAGGVNAQNCSDDDDKVSYDIWDVFCNPISGLATSGVASANTGGVVGLEVALKQNTIAADGDNDHLLAFEWVSRETENNSNIANAAVLSTSLCGEPNQDIASNLDVYCIRFRP